MEDDMILKQPTDRRLGSNNTLPIGPPGAELDAADFDSQKPPKDVKEPARESTSKSSRRRSPSGSPPPSKRKSPPRGRRTPSPSARRRRSPSPRGGRGRYRDYSPERRRYDGRSRRSPDRRRSPLRDRDRRNGRADRGGYRGRSRSRTRSPVSPRRNNSRWSPKKKPNSPPMPQLNQPPPNASYGVMAPNMYGEAYVGAYGQYPGTAPPQGFVQPDFTMAPPPGPGFPPAYQAAPPWGVAENYAQQTWMAQTLPDPSLQMQQPPPAQIQQPTAAQQPVVPPAAPVPAPQMSVLTDAAPGTVDPNPVHDAVAQEAENQRDELKKQRASYLKKTAVLKKELKMLKEQRKDLNFDDAPPSPTTKGFIDENEKLQGQIQKKLSTIENVIDMLTGIIGEDNLDKESDSTSTSPKETAENEGGVSSARKKKHSKSASTSDSSSDSSSSESTSSSSSSSENEDDDSSPERLKHKAIESMRLKQKDTIKKENIERKAKEELKKVEEQKKFNYVFYDPEMHWCKMCDLFPKTAKDYLNHLHSKEHLEREQLETPWHSIMVNDQYPTYENAPTKRTPIRGLTFFVPATAWYCKLCNIWMGDLHCASSHLKSLIHSNKYNSYLEKNPHFEVDWLAERQRTLNEKRSVPPPQQITSVSTTASEHVSKKSKKDEEKSKKRKKKSSDKKEKKKKKRSKKRKKAAASSSSSSSSDTSSEGDDGKPAIKDLNNENPAASIRVAMRKQAPKSESEDVPPPPIIKLPETQPTPVVGPIGKWTVTQEANKPEIVNEEEKKRDDAIISQWNTVQPVISESEKKLLEQLKGKLKNKPKEEPHPVAPNNSRAAIEPVEKEREKGSLRRDDRDREVETDRRRRSRSRSPRYSGRRRSRSRSRGRGGYRGGRGGRRSRSRSRGRYSPGGWRDGGRRRRSRSRSMRRRSRSHDRRRRDSRSRSRSRSGSTIRIEKPIVRHPEFRPRVPEKDKKQTEAKEKKDAAKKAVVKTKAPVDTGKKLPFIGKMPVFKKQSSGADGIDQKDGNEVYEETNAHMGMVQANAVRPVAPTAAQIQMAMMEDAYGNAPPFHPDASMMVDYDDLMPDPVQFVNIMGQAPPPPPPESEDDKDMLPPGIDETESEEFVPKPISDAPIPRKGPLPKDFEEALNIIFPGEKKPGDDDDKKTKPSAGETQIIVDEPVMQPEDLAREGIHLVTIEETSAMGLDEASQLSMNEPLVFNKRGSKAPPPPEDTSSQNALDIDLASIEPPPLPPVGVPPPPVTTTSPPKAEIIEEKVKSEEEQKLPPTPDIPIPESKEDITSAVVYDLDDIPQPPPSPTESEKNRRQEELDDLAMLGIDASDMAAQCM